MWNRFIAVNSEEAGSVVHSITVDCHMVNKNFSSFEVFLCVKNLSHEFLILRRIYVLELSAAADVHAWMRLWISSVFTEPPAGNL